MSINVQWYDETHKIIHWNFAAAWNTYDLHMAYALTYNMLQTADHRVDIIATIEPYATPMDAIEGYEICGFPVTYGIFIVAHEIRRHSTISKLVEIFYKRSNHPILWAPDEKESLHVISNLEDKRRQERYAYHG